MSYHIFWYGMRTQDYLEKKGMQCQYWDCFCPSIPTNIFRACWFVYFDASTYFYSSNKFQLLGRQPSDLNTILALSPLALSAMTSLQIRLNCWPCVQGHDMYFEPRNRCEACYCPLEFADPVLTDTTDKNMDMITAWETACMILSERIQPGQLHLTFICDASSPEVARRLCRSMEHLPRLKGCTIRLGRNPSYALIAREAAMKQTQISPLGCFPFFRLPAEIRQIILSYTHLNPAADRFAPRFNKLRIINNRIELFGRHFAKSSRMCCHFCTETGDSCCCPGMRAAFSATCICRIIPYQLFLVSKQMKEEAEYVLYSKNSFKFEQDLSRTILYFVIRLRRNLGFIRCMCFDFEIKQISQWKRKTRDEWRALVGLIRDNFRVETLCLVIDTRWTEDLYLPGEDEPYLRYFYNVYCEMVLELLVLHGLQDLHVKLPWPRPLERLLEQEIMGKDYDSHHGNNKDKEKGLTDDRRDELPRWHTTAWKAITSKYANRKALCK